MSQWDPNDPNNPYNQQQQWGQQQGHGQQGHGQQGHGQQQWGQQQGHQQQQQWGQQGHEQQQQWGQQQGHQPQQQWDQQQAQPQQQWDQQPQAAWGQDQGQQQHAQSQQQTWGQQAQQWGAQAPAMQGAGHGNAAYQDAYNETFGSADSAAGAIATLGVNERVEFLRKTYLHLFGAVAVFALIEFLFLWQKSPLYEAVTLPMVDVIFAGSRFVWLGFLAAFMAVGYIAERWAQSDTSQGRQYLGLGLYVLAEGVIFVPLLYIAQVAQAEFSPGWSIIGVSGVVTIAIFAGLTLTVFITKKDFSFMRGILSVGAMAAMGLIVASIVFGFHLGIVFSAAMLLLAGGYILYYTSKVMKYYRPGQHVAASLALFAALALLFWYVVRIAIWIASQSR